MDYRMTHQPFEDGDPLWNLSANGTFPPDTYQPERIGDFVYGDWGWQSAAIVLAVRGKPDAMVRIFRAVPHGVDVINTGDWVYLQLGQAQLHGWISEEEQWPILTTRVPASTIRSGGSDLIEWGYFGPTVTEFDPL